MAIEEFDYDAMMKALENLGDMVENQGYPDDDGNDSLRFSSDLLNYGPNPYKDEPDPDEHKKESPYVPMGDGKTEKLPEYITEDDIGKYSSVIYPEKKVLRSLVLEIFTPEQLLMLERLERNYTISNNAKTEKIKRMLTEWGKTFSPLGPGTNRYGIMCDGYVIKIALDGDGKIDNCREFIYSRQLQPYVVKCYELAPDGLVAVFEYLEIFTVDDLYKNQSTMREMLTDIAAEFLIGDVGISSVNYLNWGYRDGTEPVILDFAYIYSVKYNTFNCQCNPSSLLHYDKDFNNLICPICGRKYTFGAIRKRISREEQKREIGDVMEKGYVISSEEQEVPFNYKYTSGARDKILKKLLKIKKKQNQEDKECDLMQQGEPDEILTDSEIMEGIMSGELLKDLKEDYNG